MSQGGYIVEVVSAWALPPPSPLRPVDCVACDLLFSRLCAGRHLHGGGCDALWGARHYRRLPPVSVGRGVLASTAGGAPAAASEDTAAAGGGDAKRRAAAAEGFPRYRPVMVFEARYLEAPFLAVPAGRDDHVATAATALGRSSCRGRHLWLSLSLLSAAF